ncbi:threonine--tRNA ligase [Candidatus Gottesmanbacteria bacterium]|nr:threonine--tRNA ligase [Candidatus Gottesmanbacteria bacterium]
MKNDSDYLNNLRHSCAHLLAKAVLELYPGAHNAIGPSIEHGFYQDFDMGSHVVSESDLPKIEAKMREILPSWTMFQFNEVSFAQAKKLFKHNPYKMELIEEFAGEGKKLLTNNPGDFLDLCKMGHVENPSQELSRFKLLSTAGAYWRGSEKNKMLTRIYGTCFPSQKELDTYILQQKEARKRDHRKLGKELELFLLSPSVGPGFPLYMPKGFMIRRTLEHWLTKEKENRGYQFVWTPHVAKSDLYKQSGHWQKYDAMFSPMKIDDDEYVLKPMNCPHHFQIYNEKPRSYRDLPLRIAENATVYRFEKAGEVNGLLRVRALTQDDSHIFVRHFQISSEIDNIIELTLMIYKTFGFKDFKARISTRDPKNQDKYMGNTKSWDDAENALIDAAKRHKLPHFIGIGEAAFYGPKIDMMVRDAIGREWQLTTCQLDFVQPENFDLCYINEEGKNEKAAVLHVAILGSFDRFFGILIEHYGGAFPLWLAPVQVTLIPIAERHTEYAQKFARDLREQGIRVELDSKNEPMQARIRNNTLQKVPYMGIIGDKEVSASCISVRHRSGVETKGVTLSAFKSQLLEKIEHKV